jgi:hypothetical protein
MIIGILSDYFRVEFACSREFPGLKSRSAESFSNSFDWGAVCAAKQIVRIMKNVREVLPDFIDEVTVTVCSRRNLSFTGFSSLLAHPMDAMLSETPLPMG